MRDIRHSDFLEAGFVTYLGHRTFRGEQRTLGWESEGVGVCRVKLHPEFMSELFINADCDASGAVVLSNGALSNISMCRVRCLVVHSVFFFLRCR